MLFAVRRTVAALIAAGALSPASIGAATSAEPKVFLLEGSQLIQTRQRVRGGDKSLATAVADLSQQADRALAAGPFSVVTKDAVPPSGDKRDYMSLAPYWWPNPATSDGLPYIRRDGERNPEIHKLRNREDLGEMVDAVETLALAYYFTADEKYASRAAVLIRHWFLDPKTGMIPNLQYAQAIRGLNEGRGEGLIETRTLTRIVDSIGLLAGSRAWSADDQLGAEEWFKKFLEWMLTSALGRDEANSENNHGTFYDVQIACYALFVGKQDVARKVLQTAGNRRIAMQACARWQPTIRVETHESVELQRRQPGRPDGAGPAGGTRRRRSMALRDQGRTQRPQGARFPRALRHRRPRVATSANQRLFAGHLLPHVATGCGEISEWTLRSHAGEASIATRDCQCALVVSDRAH